MKLHFALESGTHLPAGCSIQLERKARERVIANIRESMLAGMRGLVRDIADYEQDTGSKPTLGRFLGHHRLDPDEVYRRQSWTELCARAGVRERPAMPDGDLLAKWLRRIAHADDLVRLKRWQKWLRDGKGDDSLVLALATPVISGKNSRVNSASDLWALLQRNPDILEEAQELITWRMNQPESKQQETVDGLDAPLVVHASYTRDEVLALTGIWGWREHPPVREGVRHVPDKKLDLFLATIQKNEKQYSPSTLYQDYAISPEFFHWQSQSTTSEDSPTGRRYINHKDMGYTPLLFVRSEAKVGNYSQPYCFLGPVEYQSHEGSRPMSVIWKLTYAMPARFVRQFQTLAAG